MGEYEDELTLRDLVDILRKKQRWIWGFTAGSLLAAALYVFFLAEPVYESSAVLSVSPLKVKAQLEEKIQLQQRGLLTFEGLKALALSQETLARTLELARKNSSSWPESWKGLEKAVLLVRLKSKLSLADKTAKAPAAGEPPTLIVVQKAKAGDPGFAAALANAWVEVTAQMVNELPALQLEANLRVLGEQIAAAERDYREAQTAWKQFKAKDERNAWKDELKRNESRIAEIASRLAQIPTELQVHRAAIDALRKELASTPEKLTVRSALVANPLAEAAAFELEPQLRALKGLAMQNETINPAHLDIKQKLHVFTVMVAQIQTEKAVLQTELRERTRQAAELRKRIAEAEAKANRLEENLRLTEEVYLALKQKQTDLKIELASLQNSLAQVLSPAYPIPEPVAPRKMLILALSGFLGLMIGVFMAFLSAALEPPGRRVNRREASVLAEGHLVRKGKCPTAQRAQR